MTYREELLSLGMKPDELDTWCSDLYVKVTPISSEWLRRKIAEHKPFNFSRFKSQIDGTTWYEIPFGYMVEDYMDFKNKEGRFRPYRKKAETA